MKKHNVNHIDLSSESDEKAAFINEKREILVDGQNIKKMELKKQKLDYILNEFENDENGDGKKEEYVVTHTEKEDQNDHTAKEQRKYPTAIKGPTYKGESQNGFKNTSHTKNKPPNNRPAQSTTAKPMFVIQRGHS